MSMSLRALFLAVALIAIPLLGAGCSTPFQVAYVNDPSAKIQGIRYKLKRPTYSVSLQLDLTKTNVFDRAAGVYVTGGWSGCPSEEDCQDRDLVLSIKGGPNDLCPENLDGEILIAQNMSRSLTFEVRNDDALSILKTLVVDSQLGVSLDEAEEGYLSSVTASANDQLLPFVEAVAALTVSIAKVAAAAAVRDRTTRCLPEQFLGLDEVQQNKFLSYLHRHASLAARKRVLEAALKRIDIALTTAQPNEFKDLLEARKDVDKSLSELREELKIVSYDIPEDKYILSVDGEHVAGKGEEGSNWINIELTKGEKL